MQPLGHLTLICGPMFAGKSTALIERLRTHQQQGRRVVAVKPARDDRYDDHRLATHAGGRFEALAIDAPGALPVAVSGAEVVGIDEAHFFGAALVGPVLALLGAGRRVLVAGLERDHRGEPFEPMPRLLCEADEVVKLSGPCAVCGRPAVHSQRMTASRERIVVGGAGMYEPRCRACFQPGV
jgi:thymidine kinase